MIFKALSIYSIDDEEVNAVIICNKLGSIALENLEVLELIAGQANGCSEWLREPIRVDRPRERYSRAEFDGFAQLADVSLKCFAHESTYLADCLPR
jgi:hypothetical protein